MLLTFVYVVAVVEAVGIGFLEIVDVVVVVVVFFMAVVILF